MDKVSCMEMCYNRLWKMLIDRHMTKTQSGRYEGREGGDEAAVAE